MRVFSLLASPPMCVWPVYFQLECVLGLSAVEYWSEAGDVMWCVCVLQYRVESMMLRLAKPLNFIPVSPSVQQRARQKAPECIPLTLEPQSRFYTDPVVVLDFQSLYPSIMIAYNYCFSTCLGRVENLAQAQSVLLLCRTPCLAACVGVTAFHGLFVTLQM